MVQTVVESDYTDELDKGLVFSKVNIALVNALNHTEPVYFIPDNTEPQVTDSELEILKVPKTDVQLNIFLESLNELIKQIEDWARERLLPELFDIVISGLFYFAEKTNQEPFFSLKSIYELFGLFGMKDFSIKTINRISNALLWKKCSLKWADSSFCKNFYLNLANGASEDMKIATLKLYQIVALMEIEEKRQSAFRNEINDFLSDF